jgi:adenosylcobinamide-GDP ribazoletransferase
VNPLSLALSFLTILPVPGQGKASHADFVRSRMWYPVAGLAIGLPWAALAWGLSRTDWPLGLRGVLLLALPLILTGFLHLDGLLDSADALLCPREPARRLEILKDVHMGSFAFGGGALWILLTWQILSIRSAPWVLLALPVLSRGILLLPIHLFPYAREVDASSLSGTGPSPIRWIVPLLVAAPFAILFPFVAGAVLVCQILVALWASRRLGGGITGDVYGLLICLSETSGLAAHVLWSVR